MKHIGLIESVIYNFTLNNSNAENKFAIRVKKEYERILANSVKDSAILTLHDGKPLLCPFSHKMLFYQKDFPLYDRQLSRLCNWLASSLNREIGIIDVGANIGDTVRNIGIKNAFYLCIEGNEEYSRYIKSNLKGYRYVLENVFLCDKESLGEKYSILSTNGTGHLTKDSDRGHSINTITLDELICKKYNDKKFDLLKIDTDGFDFKVIRGGGGYLKENTPLLYFEWDKAYCKEQGVPLLSIFPLLEKIGYTVCILFDNYGNYYDCVATSNSNLLQKHIENTVGDRLPYYYDVLAIPKDKGFQINELISLFQ